MALSGEEDEAGEDASARAEDEAIIDEGVGVVRMNRLVALLRVKDDDDDVDEEEEDDDDDGP